MANNNVFSSTKEHISLIINSLIEMIKNPKLLVDNNAFFYHPNAKKNFYIYIYLFKLLINEKDYIETKYNKYLDKFNEPSSFDTSGITNIKSSNEFDLLITIKHKLELNDYYYNEEDNKIYFKDNTFIDSKWLLSFISLLLDNTKNNDNKEINICYTIPNKDLSKITEPKDNEMFLSDFTYYSIKVRHIDSSKPVKENNILVVKNAAINYLKHLKQYKHGLESEDSYKIFYNLLKKECQKDGFELREQVMNLLEADKKILDKIYSFMDDEFYNSGLSKQVHLIENIVWQASNDITLLEHMNTSIDHLIDFLTIINLNKKNTYLDIKKANEINEIQILLILISSKFLLIYLNNADEIDYSLLDLSSIKPKYMNSICRYKEQELKNKLKNLSIELTSSKKNLDKYKKERASLNREKLGDDKYKKELEKCVSNINRVSIIIARLNSNISSLSKEYEDLKKEQNEKYRNVDLYNYNHSIIKHICNSIMGCSFYLKTNNSGALLSNIIIFEDYERTDNSFYLEVSFKELLKISSQYLLNGIIDQNDLPKLA